MARKVCRTCSRRRDLKFFSSKGKGRWQADCKDCRNQKARDRTAAKRAERDVIAEAEAIIEDATRSSADQEPPARPPADPPAADRDDDMMLVPAQWRPYLETADKLEEMIESLVPDVMSRLYGHLQQVRLLGVRIVTGKYLPQDMTAYQKSLDKILDIVEARRKELSSRDVGMELLEEWQSFQSSAGFVKRDAS